MAQAVTIATAGNGGGVIRDTLLLTHDQRRMPRGTIVGLRGTAVEFAPGPGTRLRQDDIVLLDDGSAVEVVARPEPLLEVRASDPATLARAAWLLGDHHIPVEIHARYLRLLRTESASSLLRSANVTVRELDAPFEPEGGAYDHAEALTG